MEKRNGPEAIWETVGNAHPDEDAQPIPLMSDLRMPDLIWAHSTLSLGDATYKVTMKVEPVHGRYEATSVNIEREGDAPITADVLRRVQVQTNVVSAVAFVSLDPESKWGWPEGTGESTPLPELARSGGRAGPSEELLREVASVFEAAYLLDLGTTLEVQKQFEVSRPTATRWVAEAKRRGYIKEGD
jgi:hypothetical protein